MSRYKPYPSYKDSGIEWLGDVPEHWGIGLLSSLFSDNKEKNAGLKNSNLLSLSYGNIIQKDIDILTGLLPESFDSYQIVHPGYIVLRLTDLQNDKKSLRTGFVRETGIITSAYVGLAKKSQFIGNEKYFHLYLHTFDTHKGFYGMGAGVRQGLNFDELKKLKFTLPPYEEQNRIVEFVEKGTAKIDILIAKQQRMIELLSEKRSALISHTVTKGLDSNVKMKDSGVEWLGEVPEHWIVCTLRHFVTLIDGDRGKEYPNENDIQDEGIPFLSSKNIIAGELNLSSVRYISLNKFNALNRGKVFDQDLIVKVRGSTGRIGEMAKFSVTKNGYETAFINAQMMIIRPSKNLLPNYLLFLSQSHGWKEQLDLAAYGTAQQQLSNEIFLNLIVAMPDYIEQQLLIDHLDIQTAKIDTLIAKAHQAIELMKERRIALISAAVTGKLDVRGIH